jgi:putative transposase
MGVRFNFKTRAFYLLNGVKHQYIEAFDNSAATDIGGRPIAAEDVYIFHNVRQNVLTPLPERQVSDLLAAGSLRQFLPSGLTPNRQGESAQPASPIPPDGPNDPKTIIRQFYALKFDESPVSRSHASLQAFINKTKLHPTAQEFSWTPSPGSLRRALNKGEPGNRPLRLFARKQPVRPSCFDPLVEDAIRRSVAWYYSLDTRTVSDAEARLSELIRRLNVRRQRASLCRLKSPSPNTFWRRIVKNENRVTIAAKFGEDRARKRYDGVRESLNATHVLEYVLFDHHSIDCILVIDPKSCLPLGRAWLALAMDLFSRTVLGYFITFASPSLYSVSACLKRALLPKHSLTEGMPYLVETYDVFGKPSTIIVDNAWEDTGKSFIDSMSDVGIDVIWAPIKTPEYKAFIERLFATLNKKLFHKLPGSIPFPAHIMRQLGFDPAKTAVVTLDRLEDLVTETIVDVYHTDVHDGLGMPPLRKWREGVRSTGINVFADDPRLLDALIGIADEVRVTRDGVDWQGLRFHDPVAVTRLLSNNGHASPRRNPPKGSVSIVAKMKGNPGDLSQIAVWDATARDYEYLPCVDRRYSAGLDIGAHRQLTAYAKAANLAFRTDDERMKVKNRLRAHIEHLSPALTMRARRKQHQLLNSCAVSSSAKPVLLAHAEPRHDGMAPYQLPTELHAKVREDDGRLVKGLRRGGKKRRGRSTARSEGNSTKSRRDSESSNSIDRNGTTVSAHPVSDALLDQFRENVADLRANWHDSSAGGSAKGAKSNGK